MCLIMTAGILKIITIGIRKYPAMSKETRIKNWETKLKKIQNVKKGEQNKMDA